jgi:FlaA1/EpsC-like NDP-sugar epimerase
VPSCEFIPIEAVRTNVLGCDNVLDSAIRAGVKKVIVLSTDKAVYPINAMGLSKALSGKVMVSRSRHDALHDDPRRRGGSGALCLRTWPQRRHLRAEVT